MNEDTLVDIPFDCRFICYFCGEPSHRYFTFPHSAHIVLDCPHTKLTLPCCQECLDFAHKAKVDDIWQVRTFVKHSIVKKYRKDLAIGLNWTPESLANSGFEGGNFESFQKSAWFMYLVAKSRVNYSGWLLSVNGIDIELDLVKESFNFDGVEYPTINDAILQYEKTFNLHKGLLTKSLAKIGNARFSEAVRFCRLLVNATPNEMKTALANLN